MNNLNRVIVNGNLTNDCKCEYGKSGIAYGGFCIAVNSSEKKDGEYVDCPSFFEVKTFGKLFESQHPYLKKGANVTVEGKLKQENWETKEGAKRSKVVIVSDTLYLSPRKKEGGSGAPRFESVNNNAEPENQMPDNGAFQEDFPW